ncbi:MAG: NADH-quinone oxidoreductase subunit N [Candidatus Glassbacteria bacterium]
MVGEIKFGIIGLEAAVFALGILIMTLDMIYRGSRPDIIRKVAIFGMALLVGYSFHPGQTGIGWHGMLLVDSAAYFFKSLFLVAALLVFIMMTRSEELVGRVPAEYYALGSFATLGMLFMASSHNLMTLFMALELLTISFYILVAYSKDEELGLEAGIKYLIIGTVSAAFILLGIAFIYGATGSLDYSRITEAIQSSRGYDSILIPGVILLLLGLGFKISAIPFHSWAPDVYQGAPTPVVAFLSVGSKAAGFILLQRLIYSVFIPLKPTWGLLLSVVAVITLLYGNLGAIPQTNIKRLLGYSGIAQAGYLILGLVAGSLDGGAAMLYYLTGYLFSNLLAFTVIVIFRQAVTSHRIIDYSGLARRSPILAASLLVAMLSLAGVPPLVGFFGKFLLIESVIRAGYSWLAIVAILNVVVALFYYLQVVRVMYVNLPTQAHQIKVSRPMKAVLYACIVAILALGLFQGPLYDISLSATRPLF